MTTNKQMVGRLLSQQEMKSLKGGIIWPYFMSFTCSKTGAPGSPGGCTDNSSFGVSCCRSQYGSSYAPVWGTPGDCSAQSCGWDLPPIEP